MTKKRTILNLQKMRAERDRIVIVDPKGKEFDLSGITVDSYLQIIEYEDKFKDLDVNEGSGNTLKIQEQLLEQTRNFVESIMPGFDTEDLYLDELFAVFAAIQSGIEKMQGMPDNKDEGEGSEKNLTLPK